MINFIKLYAATLIVLFLTGCSAISENQKGISYRQYICNDSQQEYRVCLELQPKNAQTDISKKIEFESRQQHRVYK